MYLDKKADTRVSSYICTDSFLSIHTNASALSSIDLHTSLHWHVGTKECTYVAPSNKEAVFGVQWHSLTT